MNNIHAVVRKAACRWAKQNRTPETAVKEDFPVTDNRTPSRPVTAHKQNGICLHPTIKSDRTIATVTFPLKSAIQRLNMPDVPINVPVKLTGTQQKVLELISSNPSITHLEMAHELTINEKTAKRVTQILRKSGLIKRVGSNKTGVWIVCPPK